MRKIDDMIPRYGFVSSLLVVITLGVLLQLSLSWITMPLVGLVGALFTRRHKRSFYLGFLGVSIAWSIIFAYLSVSGRALITADFFISMVGLSGMGWLVIVISVIIGGLLGGFGGLVGRSLVEVVDEITNQED